ncbi:MAG: TonB-dependent receptor [Pseudomonadota bacterium]
MTLAVGITAQAQEASSDEVDQRRLAPVTVTATKRSESAQNIPVTVSALGEETLYELNVSVFTDYLVQLPGVTAGGSGPGQNTIYIRGLASTTPNLTTAGVAGLAPNVALYLDEQPVSQPGRNLDVYAADLERVEVLSGPQGTLFGASSQAGTVRLITNKPNLDEFEANLKLGTSFTEGGEFSQSVEAVLNIPVTDKFALRAVGYVDDQGGYIDNVAGTRTAAESARFRPEGFVRANGVPVSAFRAGFQAGADLSNVNFLPADNAVLVEEDFNDATYAGFRLSGLYEFNSDWQLTVSHSQQSIESDGVFFNDPELDDLEIQRFAPDSINDDYSNTAWTLDGRLGFLEAVYTGAFTDRDTDQTVDYTDYLFVGQYLPYYICDGSVTYPGDDGPAGTCQAPNLFVNSATDTKIQTHELRFNTPAEYRLRATVGGFYSDLELTELNDFVYPGSQFIDLFGLDGFPENFSQPTAFQSTNLPLPPGGIFRNDIRRTDEQFGIFGEATLEVVPNTLEVTFGARYYDIDVDFEGSANASFCNSSGVDENAFGTNLSDLFDGDGSFTFIGTCADDLRQTFTLGQTIDEITAAGLSEAQAQQVINSLNAPDTASTDGVIFKGNVSWTPTDDLLFYFTYSEGFRPGLLNRPGGALGPNGFTVPFALDTDDVQNYEVGWKTTLFNQLQFNGSAFYVDISDLQTTIFDPAITNLFFSDNAADAELYGLEADLIWAPPQIEGLTITSAFSILDTQITEVLTPTGDVIEGDELAFAPNFQGNLRARYEWDVLDGKYLAHVQGQGVYSGESFSDIITINRAEIDDWFTLALATGVTADKWSAEFFVDNVTDERAELANNFVFDRERVTVNRPRTYGIRLAFQY